MAHFAEINLPGFMEYCTGSVFTLEGLKVQAKENFKAVFEAHRHRVYSLAFYMTDNELAAEEISTRVFLRAFHSRDPLTPELIDVKLLSELRELAPIGPLTLNEKPQAAALTRNTRRHELERAVVDLPPTERLAFLLHDVEGYDHTRIANTLGITAEESAHAVFQARIRVRNVIAGNA